MKIEFNIKKWKEKLFKKKRVTPTQKKDGIKQEFLAKLSEIEEQTNKEEKPKKITAISEQFYDALCEFTQKILKTNCAALTCDEMAGRTEKKKLKKEGKQELQCILRELDCVKYSTKKITKKKLLELTNETKRALAEL